ncbi:hypothetical protein DSM106972_061210 [Dulcicalothrix desertica PCC 7102]|uniref:Shedu protein SduA C-terminal domain-containing protein n=1 Tax=Dulcicalothrix desertica PCC 7102 TaxID=232991 RepID=A0A3S1C813_9CYAN|nr:Shedu immune nuclease family protein [Dulcicalothrix desertica]RUT02046.1 hypothetical protein DSM106972_061210 [Dulcicalothrix desertica PCC 7102]TWH53693.1 uncharacterized protein DUF4263 [Dulcicalothrix desertica PCC 7102]
MKEFAKVNFDPVICRFQLEEFKELLQQKQSLSEKNDILPFFRERTQLSVFLGSYHKNIERLNRVAFEYDIFGDFAADLVVGDSRKKSYCFIEFEDARLNSVFVSKPGRYCPEWSPRFEKGFSQIIDWFWKIDDLERTDDFENRFGSRRIDYIGMLVIGRNDYLEPRDKKRLVWRQEHLVLNSKHVYCLTFDDLYNDLLFRINKYYRIETDG